MTKAERKVLLDLKAYIEFELNADKEDAFDRAMFTLMHDVGGIIREERCFLPRTHDYSKKVAA